MTTFVGYPKILPADRNRKWDEENAAITAIGNPEAEEKAKTFASLLLEGAIGPSKDAQLTSDISLQTSSIDDRGRGREVVCKYLSGFACIIL